jgi:hypothetical protein
VKVLKCSAQVGHHEKIEKLKPTTERHQTDETAMKAAQWQALHPGSYGGVHEKNEGDYE